MFRILIVLLFVVGLLAAGCKTERPNLSHRGCHRIGVNRARRNTGVVHHHYAKPVAPDAEKAK